MTRFSEPDAALVAKEYERSLSPESRRRSGAVYTPRYLAEFILDLAGHGLEPPPAEPRVLDPACGCGVFLACAAGRLVEGWRRGGADPGSRSDALRLRRLVERRLFGVDTDPRACELAVQSVREVVAAATPATRLPAAYFAGNVRCADFLELGPAGSAKPARGRSPFAGPFDLVAGNPPYVSTARLSGAAKAQLRTRFSSAFGRIDLYALFLEHAVEFLAPGGTLAFITPDKYLTTGSARRLRETCLLYTSPSPRDQRGSRMPSSA